MSLFRSVTFPEMPLLEARMRSVFALVRPAHWDAPATRMRSSNLALPTGLWIALQQGEAATVLPHLKLRVGVDHYPTPRVLHRSLN